MRQNHVRALIVAAGLAAGIIGLSSPAMADPVGTAFTYQGELRSIPSNAVFNGQISVRFRLYGSVSGTDQIGSQTTPITVTATDGKFTIPAVDFGDVFCGQARWLEVDVSIISPNPAPFVTLTPRQRVAPAPAAECAVRASTADFATAATSATTAASAANATNLGGQPASAYPTLAGANNFANNGNSFTGTHIGSGSALTGLNASNLASGTIADARLSSNVALLNLAQTFSAAKTFGTTTIFNGSVGIGTASPSAPLHLLGSAQQMMNTVSSNTGGTWFDFTNSSAGGRTWNLISTGSGNGEGAGHFLIRNNNAGSTAMTILGSTNAVGIGTSTPGAGVAVGQAFEKLEIAGPDVGVRIRNTNDVGGGVLWNSFGTLHMGMYNPGTVGNTGVVTPLTRRAFLSVSNDGRVGSTTNTGGSPTFRNLLDDGNGNMIVRTNGTLSGNHVALFENTGSANADGIAIKINNLHTNRDNNFVTFYNGSGAVTGRIEGFDVDFGDWEFAPPPAVNIPQFSVNTGVAIRPANQWFNPGTLPTSSLCCANNPSLSINFLAGSFNFNPGNPPTLNFNAGTLPSITGDPLILSTPSVAVSNLPTVAQMNDLANWGVGVGHQVLMNLDPTTVANRNLILNALRIMNDEGVTYGSKGADYAEWLEKANPAEHINFGEIVGVKGGKISRDTANAEQVMVISHAPVVLGNVPPQDKIQNYEKVAFMGQIPAVVRGKVNSGDYIVPSGANDGTAIAVSPANLKSDHLGRIIGRAWENSKNDIIGFVNVVVGVNTQETSKVLAGQQDQLEAQKRAQADLKVENLRLRAEVDRLKAGEARIVAAVEHLEASMKRMQSAPATR